MKTDDQVHQESLKDPEYQEATIKHQEVRIKSQEHRIEQLMQEIKDLRIKHSHAVSRLEIWKLRNDPDKLFPNGSSGPKPDDNWLQLARHHAWDDHNQEKWITTRERRDFGIRLSVSEGWDDGPEARIRFTPQPDGYPDVISLTIADLDGFIDELKSLRGFMKELPDAKTEAFNG